MATRQLRPMALGEILDAAFALLAKIVVPVRS